MGTHPLFPIVRLFIPLGDGSWEKPADVYNLFSLSMTMFCLRRGVRGRGVR